MRRGSGALGAALIVLAAACFGTLGPVSRFAGEHGVSSLALVTWRSGIGAIFVTALIVARSATGQAGLIRIGQVPRRDRWLIGAAAVTSTVLNLAIFIAFGRISIALALLIFYLYPALVALASVAWFGERLDPLRWLALAVSLLGVVLIVAGGQGLGSIDLLGVTLAFVAAVAQVAYVLLARHGFSSISGPQASAATMIGAAVLYLGVAAGSGHPGVVSEPLGSPAALGLVLFAGTLGAGIPTTAYIVGIRLLGAPRAAILATLEPVVGVALAALLLHETPSLLQVVGGCLIVASGALLQVGGGPSPEHEAAPGPPAHEA
ncbi:MAG: hypothetical protein DLM71_03650 [Chloroflexi bacterium]|nr:MAG: hypothetical protein DLM71_03650 [Chloroflexota bacterium]